MKNNRRNFLKVAATAGFAALGYPFLGDFSNKYPGYEAERPAFSAFDPAAGM